MRVTVSGPKLAALKAALKNTQRNLQKELAVAVNATSKKSKSIINKEIRQELATTASAVGKTIAIKRAAKPGFPSAFVEVKKTARIPLRDFGAKQTAKGVTYKISKTKGRQTAPGAFQGPKPGVMKASWKGHVFKRAGKARLPIIKLFGASPHGVFTRGKRAAPSAAETQKELEKQIERRVRFVILEAQGKLRGKRKP